MPPASRSFYDRLIAERGLDDATDFRPESQAERFRVAAEIIAADILRRAASAAPVFLRPRVLDFGCNVGGLRAYLAGKHDWAYLGVDLHRPFVDRCNELAGETVALHGDVLDAEFTARLAALGPFDYVVASGTFCHPDQATSYPRLLQRLWCLAERGLVANFLSSLNPSKPSHMLTWHPALLMGVAAETCSAGGPLRFALRHDYLPNDFTLAVYR